jgi:hypothetical protein
MTIEFPNRSAMQTAPLNNTVFTKNKKVLTAALSGPGRRSLSSIVLHIRFYHIPYFFRIANVFFWLFFFFRNRNIGVVTIGRLSWSAGAQPFLHLGDIPIDFAFRPFFLERASLLLFRTTSCTNRPFSSRSILVAFLVYFYSPW